MSPKVSEFNDDLMLVRRTFAQFPSGVAVLATEHDGQKHALVATHESPIESLTPGGEHRSAFGTK